MPSRIKDTSSSTPLNTRDALYGGRTEAMKLYYKIRVGKNYTICGCDESLSARL